MKRLLTELSFVKALVGVNLASAMEYRASFITQIVGMLINNGIYFVFWLLFFDRFGNIRGYDISDIYLLFAIVTLGFGLAFFLAGNANSNLAYLISQGRLDYYLVFPRPLLPHIIFSRMSISTIGDIAFGFIAFIFAGRFHPVEIILFLCSSIIVAIILAGFGVVAGSLAFFMGNAQYASQQMTNALLTFSMYPNVLFSGAVRMLLYTLLPAAFVGAVPVVIVKEQNWLLLLGLIGVAIVVWGIATAVFALGLRRYESGSAINVNT